MNAFSRVFEYMATRFPRSPVAYLCLLAGWAITLWFLSAGNPVPKNAPEIPHLDKVAHFGYFFLGGGLLASCGLTSWGEGKHHRKILFLVLVVMGSVVGGLDEYHQTFTPGRSGNDIGDWIADTLGVASGVFCVLWIILPRLQRFNFERLKKGNEQNVSNSLD